MPDGPRPLPSRPSLRYLNLEAKRRLAAGEFPALHEAHVAIAREHGLPSWTALKQHVHGQPQQESHALAQLRWIIACFRDAGEPGWTAPDDHEMRQHFSDRFLAALVLAGGGPDTPPWLAAQGWADLDRAEILDPSRRFPAPGVAALVTATAALRLIADGRFGLDTPANDHLRAVRLADDTITVRELLSHTPGVGYPAEMLADTVPDLVRLAGPVIPWGGTRGVVRPSNGGYAVLGQLIADVTGSPYADAVTRLVLEPLGMHDSSFPASTARSAGGAG